MAIQPAFRSFLDRLCPPGGASRHVSIGIVGAGFGGIGMAIQLAAHGFDDVTIFEKADAIGGVWRDNTYPDAGCDVPSHLYSYSFERRTDWSRRFPKQPEILDYLHDCVDKHHLAERIKFGTEVTEARWQDADAQWELTIDSGQTHRVDVVIWGLGQLNRPKWPDIAGLDEFEGTVFHSARWNHDHDLADERIAVIGNGASAVQFVPPVADKAKILYQFQRAPNWFLPKPDGEFTSEEQRRFQRIPGWGRIYRSQLYASFESKWIALRRGSRTAKLARDISSAFIKGQVPDPDLRLKLLPDYPVGCKRILISDNYLEAMGRENVEVVDNPIVRIDPDAVITADGTRRIVDTIIVATGFETTDFLAPVAIHGRDGRSLHEEWADGASAYQGIAVPGFPNSFVLYGPHTNLNHNSIIFMLESQYRWIIQVLGRLRNGARSLDVSPAAARRYESRIDAKMAKTAFVADCNSWYKNARGKVVNNWPGPTLRYWFDTHSVRWSDLQVEAMPSTPKPDSALR